MANDESNNGNKTESDFGMEMPEGFAEVSQTRLWAVKEEGAILQGVILSRVAKKDKLRDGGTAWYYETRLTREAKATTADEDDGKKKVEIIAKPGQIVCIDEFAGNTVWQHQLPAAGKGSEFWMKFVRKESIGQGKTMWKIKMGLRSVNVRDSREEDGIPF